MTITLSLHDALPISRNYKKSLIEPERTIAPKEQECGGSQEEKRRNWRLYEPGYQEVCSPTTGLQLAHKVIEKVGVVVLVHCLQTFEINKRIGGENVN